MKFKCKTTNLIYNFEFDVDIESMLKHPDYESVPDNETPAKPTKKSAKAATTDEETVEGQ